MLARPGWAGSGISTDVWWKHPVIYQVNPISFGLGADSGLHGVVQHLDYIQSLGVDGLLLTAIQPDATHAQAIDPACGTLDDLDDLIHEASRHNIRVLLDLDPKIPAVGLSQRSPLLAQPGYRRLSRHRRHSRSPQSSH